jgi:aryl-alcohol dehydrogenase-like predicted oxidoreductase
MQYRKLGNSDLELTVIGLGTWAIGGGDWQFGWGAQDDDRSVAAITAAVDAGINWIDTAAVYGFGHSERLVGKALRSMSANDRPLVATKCGRTDEGGGKIGKCLRRESVIAECEASLQRLGVDCIDLYQLHWPEPAEQIEEGWQTLVELRQQGKVRQIGVSNHSVDQLSRLSAIHPIASLQPPYSMITRGIEDEVLPYCGRQGIGVVCYSPMGKGLLTGAFDAARAGRLPDNDHRSRDPRFQPPQLAINLRFVDALGGVAEGLGCSVAELAIGWVLRRPEVTAAIVGARSPEQIAQTAAAGSRELPTDAVAAISTALEVRAEELAALGDVEQPRV